MSSENPHDWEYSKENTAPLECGRSTKSLSKRAFGTSTAEMAQIEEKTKKYERLVRRSEKAVEWLQKQSTLVLERQRSSSGDGAAADRELTEDEGQALRERLVLELGFDPSTTDRDEVDYDPLRYWVLYIKHIRDSYPSDSQRQFLLLERCARTFMARPFVVPSYRNDVRFVRTCILYADKTPNPSEVFKLMGKIKVGTKVALFWVAWAWVAEKAQDFPFTEKIFQKALSVGAEPRKFLEERQHQFLRRMSRHWLNASQGQEDGMEDEEDGDGRRGALNSLSSEGVAMNDRGNALHRHPRQQPNRQSSNQQLDRRENYQMIGFSIFQDGGENGPPNVLDDDENAPGGPQLLPTERERSKENNMRPELWNERGYGLINPSATSTSASLPTVSDSIVGTVRHPAPDIGRPPPFGGHRRSGSVPAFDVFVEEDDEAGSNKNDVPKGNEEKVTDHRSLRQRLDGGTADRLTRDPLRYMKNPSKVESDQLKYDARPVDNAATSTSNAGLELEKRIDDNRAPEPVPKGSKAGIDAFVPPEPAKDTNSGEEYCFEERRLNQRYYTLVSSDVDFNLLKREDSTQDKNSSMMDMEESTNVEESIEEVDMEEGTEDIVIHPIKSVLKSSLRRANTAAAVNDEENTGTMNPRRVLFGANTKNVVFTNDASLNTSTASSQLNGSFVKAEETINTKVANAEISMMFSSPNVNASLAETPGKALFHDENNIQTGSLNYSTYIYQDESEDSDESVDGKKNAAVGKVDSASTGLTFAIHDENNQKSSGLNYDGASNGFSFAIHDENTQKFARRKYDQDKIKARPPAPASRSSGEDTASLSVIGNVLDGLGGDEKSTLLGFQIFSESEPSSNQISSGARESNHRSAAREIQSREMEKIEGDTADFSLINDVISSLKKCSVKKNSHQSGFGIYSDKSSVRPSRKEPIGFKVYAEDVNAKNPIKGKPAGMAFEVFSDEAVHKKQKVVRSEPSFGDISRIEDEKTSNFHLVDDNSTILSKNHDAIVYERRHRDDMESAMRKCMAAASKSRSRFAIFDNRKNPMPKALLRQSFTTGTIIDLSGGESVKVPLVPHDGGEKVTIAYELGRGVYGVVLLCNDETGRSDALKIQAPIGSLAHEYSVLLRVEDRVQPKPSAFYPFPRSRALYAFAEGGLFSMTAASDSGMTLIDVVNTYKKIMGNVPELVSIYFTSRMLNHLETLHQSGRVLHCDIKPDNWVLTSSANDEKKAEMKAVEGADLMLVDFGRSIDLDRAENRGSDLLQTQFTGSIAAEDMECAAMREGRNWGVDLDFFGLAASSFILLFGSHMDVIQDRSTGKWRPNKSFRRYWQRDLWSLLFDSLLNFDSSTDYCLSEIRAHFDGYIEGKQRKKEIAANLHQLHTHLPTKR